MGKSNCSLSEMLRKLAKDEYFRNKVEPQHLMRAASEIDKQTSTSLELHQAGCEEYERAERLQKVVDAVTGATPHYDLLSSEGSVIDCYEISVELFQEVVRLKSVPRPFYHEMSVAEEQELSEEHLREG